mgnify:CR=1 FL=1
MSFPRYWPGFARSERRRRRCGRGGDGRVVDSGGDGWAGRIVAAFQRREREEGLEDRISRLADKGEDRHAVSRHVPIYTFMHLLVLGAF